MHSKLIIAVAIIAATNTATSAGVSPTALFSSTAVETFDDLGSSRSAPISIFSDTADVSAESGILIKTTGWTFSDRGRTTAHSGRFFIGSTTGAAVYNFDAPIYAFGGFFTTNTDTPGATIEFFDNSSNLIDTYAMNVPANDAPGSEYTEWAWNAFESTDPISSVRISGNYASGGFIMMDDISISTSPVPTPGSIATAGLAGLSMLRRRRRA